MILRTHGTELMARLSALYPLLEAVPHVVHGLFSNHGCLATMRRLQEVGFTMQSREV